RGSAWLTVPYFWISAAFWWKWGWAVMPPLPEAVFLDIGVLLFLISGAGIRCSLASYGIGSHRLQFKNWHGSGHSERGFIIDLADSGCRVGKPAFNPRLAWPASKIPDY